MKISIVGAGRLGRTLAVALAKRGHPIVDLWNQTEAAARASRRFVGGGRSVWTLEQLSNDFDLLWIAVPDDAIHSVAARLSRTPLRWKNKEVWHASGARDSTELEPLGRLGARIASVHPLQTLPRATRDDVFRGAYFGIEGRSRLARKVVGELGGIPLSVSAADKPLYHALATLVCGLTASLQVEALQTFRREIGNPRALLPLMLRTAANLAEQPDERSVSGPFVRGDSATIRKHLKALAGHPKLRAAYQLLGKLSEPRAK